MSEPTDSAERYRIDELARELTEEIEAHRVTRAERDRCKEACKYALHYLKEDLDTVSRHILEAELDGDTGTPPHEQAMLKEIERAEAAEAKLAELVRDLWLWFNSGVSSELGPVHIDNFETTLRKYDPKPEGGG